MASEGAPRDAAGDIIKRTVSLDAYRRNVGGSITIDASGSYALTYKGKLNALTFDLTDEGTYSLSGSTMTFDPEDPDDVPFTGRVQGSSVLVDDFKIAGVKFELRFAGT